MTTASCLMLSGCFGSTVPALDPPPPSMVVSCPPLSDPQGDLTAADVWRYWNHDRWAASVCASRHAALAAYVDERSILD